MSYTTIFLGARSPGQVFRYFERSRAYPPPGNSLLLSDGTGEISLRCLLLEEQAPGGLSSNLDWILSCGPALSHVFPPRATLLWRHSPSSPEPDEPHRWGFTVWENGTVEEAAEHLLPPEPKRSLLSRLPGMRRNAMPSPDISWALDRGLPIDRIPAAGLRRHIPVIDYVTVSQLDQRSLLVENSPRLYRFPL